MLLVAMHYLIPKASFVGHLSGSYSRAHCYACLNSYAADDVQCMHVCTPIHISGSLLLRYHTRVQVIPLCVPTGILIGYPLAWGLMDWCGIELLARLLVFAMYCRELAFGTDRRVVSLSGPASGGSFDGTHISPADVPTVMHDGSRSKLLLGIACCYVAVTALSFSYSSWYVCV